MNGRSWPAALAATVTAAAGLTACGPPLSEYGCTDALLATLDRLPILDRHADEATLISKSAQCDPDGAYSYAIRYYQASIGRAEVLDYYRDTARQEGWAAVDAGCYSQPVAETTAYLRIWFPGDSEETAQPRPLNHSLYAIEASATHDGMAGC